MNMTKMSKFRANFRSEIYRNMQKCAEICKNLQISRRNRPRTAEMAGGPSPAGTACTSRNIENHWFSLPFRGCGLPRQRPAEAVPSWPAEAGEDEPKCAEICRNLQKSAEIAQNLRICEILLQN